MLGLADKCRGLTHASFSWCYNLTDAAVLGLADKCHKCCGLTHADFNGCHNLTDAAVRGLADTHPGLTQANFEYCGILTYAAKAVTAQRRNCDYKF